MPLTRRELSVLSLAAEGASIAEIAGKPAPVPRDRAQLHGGDHPQDRGPQPHRRDPDLPGAGLALTASGRHGRPAADEFAVQRRVAHQLLVGAVRRARAVHDQHPAGAAGRADAVGDDDQGAARPGWRRPARRVPRPPGPDGRWPRRAGRAGRTTDRPGSARRAAAHRRTAPPGRRSPEVRRAASSSGVSPTASAAASSSGSGTGSGRRCPRFSARVPVRTYASCGMSTRSAAASGPGTGCPQSRIRAAGRGAGARRPGR